MTQDDFRYKFEQVFFLLFLRPPPTSLSLTVKANVIPVFGNVVSQLCPAPPLLRCLATQIPTGTIQVMDTQKCWQGCLYPLLLGDLQRENPGWHSSPQFHVGVIPLSWLLLRFWCLVGWFRSASRPEVAKLFDWCAAVILKFDIGTGAGADGWSNLIWWPNSYDVYKTSRCS